MAGWLCASAVESQPYSDNLLQIALDESTPIQAPDVFWPIQFRNGRNQLPQVLLCDLGVVLVDGVFAVYNAMSGKKALVKLAACPSAAGQTHAVRAYRLDTDYPTAVVSFKATARPLILRFVGKAAASSEVHRQDRAALLDLPVVRAEVSGPTTLPPFLRITLSEGAVKAWNDNLDRVIAGKCVAAEKLEKAAKKAAAAEAPPTDGHAEKYESIILNEFYFKPGGHTAVGRAAGIGHRITCSCFHTRTSLLLNQS